MRNTLTRSEIAHAVHLEIGLSRNESSKLVEDVIEKMTECFVKGENVKLSSFGTFSVRSKKERIGRNPKTKEIKIISPRNVILFKPSKEFKKLINNQFHE